MDFVAAKLALFRGDHLVVMLRDDFDWIPYPAHWDFPGGGREGDETPQTCVLRELREELGVDLDPSALETGVEFRSDTYPDRTSWFFVGFVSQSQLDQMVLGDEGQAFRLMHPTEYLAHPKRIPFLADLLRAHLDHHKHS